MNPRPAVAATVFACLVVLGSACNGGTSSRVSTPGPVAPTTSSPPPVPSSPSQALASGSDKPETAQGVTAAGSRLGIWSKPSTTKPAKKSLKMVNPLGQDITMLVSGSRALGGKTWLHVYLPDRPNESQGWVRERDVRLVKLHERIEIDLSKFRLWYYKDDKLIDSFKVGIGRNIWPTPTGTFYVWAIVPQASPAGPYGAFAMGLSGFSPVLSEWPGGGRVAIHGTANPGDPGHKVSHGCIRVFNRNVVELRHVPMGTPVIIQK